MFENGIFGGLFDFDCDGKMDCLEKSAEFSFFMHILEEEKSSENDSAAEDN